MYLEIDSFLTLIAHFLKNKVYPTPDFTWNSP